MRLFAIADAQTVTLGAHHVEAVGFCLDETGGFVRVFGKVEKEFSALRGLEVFPVAVEQGRPRGSVEFGVCTEFPEQRALGGDGAGFYFAGEIRENVMPSSGRSSGASMPAAAQKVGNQSSAL